MAGFINGTLRKMASSAASSVHPLLVLGGILLANFALAQTSLPDPTRPAHAAQPSPAPHVESSAALRLESVILSAQRKIAIINGQTYQIGQQIGQQHGAARLVAISEQQVVLMQDGKKQVLLLYPDVKKVQFLARELPAEDKRQKKSGK